MNKTRQSIWVLLLLPALALAAAVVIIISSWFPYNRTFHIDDGTHIQQMSYQAVPESLTLLDPVWGSVVVDDPELVYGWYSLVLSLPFEERSGSSVSHLRNRELSGTINFPDRANIHFNIYDIILVDGIAYGDSATNAPASFLIQALCETIYSPETLSRLVDRYSRIVLRTDSVRLNLSTTQKQRLQQELRQSLQLQTREELTDLLQSRNRAICQIEIYTDNVRIAMEEREIPQVYIAVYENGLCAVYDVDNSVGSVMHLLGDLKSVRSILEGG